MAEGISILSNITILISITASHVGIKINLGCQPNVKNNNFGSKIGIKTAVGYGSNGFLPPHPLHQNLEACVWTLQKCLSLSLQ